MNEYDSNRIYDIVKDIGYIQEQRNQMRLTVI